MARAKSTLPELSKEPRLERVGSFWCPLKGNPAPHTLPLTVRLALF